MSIESINLHAASRSVEGFDYMDDEHILNRYRLKEGWEAWQKSKHLFKLKNFSFISYPSTHMGEGFIEIALVQHENFLNMVKENLLHFRKLLGQEITPELVLEGFLKSTGEIFDGIQSHEDLLGMLLGYGANNAKLFVANWEALLSFAPTPESTKPIFLPMFMADPLSEETKELRCKYIDQRNLIEAKCRESYLIPSLVALTGL